MGYSSKNQTSYHKQDENWIEDKNYNYFRKIQKQFNFITDFNHFHQLDIYLKKTQFLENFIQKKISIYKNSILRNTLISNGFLFTIKEFTSVFYSGWMKHI